MIKLPESYQPDSVCCGIDCSMVLCCDGYLLVCGSNRANKLSLDTSDTGIVEEKHSLIRVPSMPLSSLCIVQTAVGTSHTALITGTSKRLINGIIHIQYEYFLVQNDELSLHTRIFISTSIRFILTKLRLKILFDIFIG